MLLSAKSPTFNSLYFTIRRFIWAAKGGQIKHGIYFYSIHSLSFHSCSHSCSPPLNPFTYPGQPPFQWRKALLPFNRFSFIYLLWCPRSSDMRRCVRPPLLPFSGLPTPPLPLARAHTRARAHAPASWHPGGGTWVVVMLQKGRKKEGRQWWPSWDARGWQCSFAGVIPPNKSHFKKSYETHIWAAVLTIDLASPLQNTFFIFSVCSSQIFLKTPKEHFNSCFRL